MMIRNARAGPSVGNFGVQNNLHSSINGRLDSNDGAGGGHDIAS